MTDDKYTEPTVKIDFHVIGLLKKEAETEVKTYKKDGDPFVVGDKVIYINEYMGSTTIDLSTVKKVYKNNNFILEKDTSGIRQFKQDGFEARTERLAIVKDRVKHYNPELLESFLKPKRMRKKVEVITRLLKFQPFSEGKLDQILEILK